MKSFGVCCFLYTDAMSFPPTKTASGIPLALHGTSSGIDRRIPQRFGNRSFRLPDKYSGQDWTEALRRGPAGDPIHNS